MKQDHRGLKNDKRAIFYMFTVMVFLSIMAIVAYTYQSYSLRDKQESTDIRIRSMNDFINDFNTDIHRSTRITATRALIALEDHVSTHEQFFEDQQDFDDAFQEVFYYGTVNGTNHTLMQDSSFMDYERKVSANARNTGFAFFINVTDIRLEQDDPWSVKVIIDAHILLNDSSKLAYWDYNDTYITQVPIDGLRDPIYSISTFGRIQNTIRQTNVTDFETGNDTAELQRHIESGLYKASSRAPSFLMRFYDDLSASPNGIESIVDISSIYDQGLVVDSGSSIIDYKYFGSAEVADVCNVQNMPEWFRVQSSDLDEYDLDALSHTGC